MIDGGPMKEVLDDIERWRAAGHRVAVARVVGIEGSSPRDPGATMAVNDAGEVAGSVSGGCVEGAVVERGARGPRGRARAAASSRSATPTTRRSRSGSRAAARSTCSSSRSTGEPMRRAEFDACDALRAGEPVALATVIDGPEPRREAARAARTARRSARSATPTSTASSPATRSASSRPASRRPATTASTARRARRRSRVFIESFALPPRMIIFGAVDFTAALAQVAKVLGYRVTVCDARAVFATRAAVPDGRRGRERLARPLPRQGRRRARAARRGLRADARPQVRRARDRRPRSQTDVGYLGAMGSRRTHERRVERLREAGVTDAEIARVMSPIGLDIGARTPEETAVAICAEIIALRTGRRARVAARHCRAPFTDRRTAGEESRGSRNRGTAGRGRGRVARARVRGRARRSRPRACRSRSAAATASTIDAAAARHRSRTRCRSSPTCRHVDGADRLRARRARRARRHRHPRAPTPADRRRATSRRRPSTQYLDAFELNCRSTIAMCYEAVPEMRDAAVGAGASRSRRSRCASRSRTSSCRTPRGRASPASSRRWPRGGGATA